jgi:hypothetical protein
VTETIDMAAPVAVMPDARVLPRRVAARSMLPSTWMGRSLRVEYVGADGKGQKTSGTYHDHCGTGIVLRAHGTRMIFSWDRIVLAELVAD